MIQRNQCRFPDTDLVIFGHSHHRIVRRVGRTLFLNPGAVFPAPDETPSVAVLTITAATIDVRFVELA